MLPASPQRSAQPETRPPHPSPSAVSSSDAGEREERRASVLQEAYWDSLDGLEEQDQTLEATQRPVLDASPKASTTSPGPSNTRISPSPARDSSPPSPSSSQRLFVDRSPPPRLNTSQPTSSHHSLPPPSPRRARQPTQSSSDDDLELVALGRRSSPRSPEPPSSPIVIPPEQPAGRSFRNRTAAQLNPYSIEQAKYTRTLLRNGWQGAVVAGPRRGEESAEDLQRRKLAAAQAPKDDLGGWLEYEDGQQVVGGRASSAPPETFSEDSEDGHDLLAREALRRSRLAREVDAAFRGGGASRPSRDDIDAPRQPHHQPAARRVPAKAKQARSHHSSRRAYSSDNEQGPSKKRGRSDRGDSEPPTSSPPSAALEYRPKSRKTAAPSKSFHARQGQTTHRSTLDARILEISSPSSSSPRHPPLDLTRSDSDASMHSEDDDDDEEDDEPEEVVAERARARLNLGGKRKRALGMMMPAVFMKKAQADLRLMEREKKDGVASGSDMGSGDEDAVSDGDGSEERRRNRARIRTVPRLLDQPLVFDGEAFTDESGDEDDRRESPVTSEDEGDAVLPWLHSFAPQRQKVSDEDIVDRFLKRSRGHSKSTSAARRPTKYRSGGRPVKKKLKDTRRPQLHEKQNTLHSATASASAAATSHSSRGAIVSKRVSVPTKAIPLDTDAALFQAAARVTDRTLSRSLLPRPPPSPPPDARQANDNERWASFGKFSDDFGIRRLPVGVRFAPHSFINRGHLFSLLNPPTLPFPLRSTMAFGVHLSSSSPPSEVGTALSIICDAIFDHLSRSGEGEPAELDQGDDAPGEVLRFLGSYITEALSTRAEAECSRFAETVLSQLERLESRLDSLVTTAESLKRLNSQRIGVSWYLVDITARLSIASTSVDSSRVAKQAAALVRRLLQHGTDHTTKSLKSLSDEDPVRLLVDDPSVDAWLGLISLALNSSGDEASLRESDLWRIVVDETLAALSMSATSSPVAGEVLSYTTMMLCAISQFSPAGVSTSSPRLPAHWAIASRVLGPIDPLALSKSDHTLSNTAIARRDRYLWTLFARCLVFVERWDWRIDGREDLLPKLFDLLNARRLADLSIEAVNDFPPFLQDLEHFNHSPLDREADTAFTTFLKLVIHTANNVPAKSDADRRRQLTRLFLRLAPIISSPWTRRSPELAGSASALVNHYSLYMTFAMLSPSSASQRLDQARRLLSFGEVDEEARRTCIRAVLYFAFIFLHHNLFLAPIIDWLASIAEQLRTEYVDIERQRRREERTGAGSTTMGGRRGKQDALWHRAVLVTMVLRSVQLMMRGKGEESSAYPDSGLLHPAWTSQLLDSPLALDPMIGSEVVKTIASFLDARRRALPHRSVEEPAGESQDDFGMFDIDFEDPALDALLGVERDGQATAPQDDLKAKELAFAELIKTNLSPAFFRLVSNILIPDHVERGGPTVGDRSAYAQQIVECWTRCLTVMIENDVVEWSGYLRYGDHSWKRISDPLGRRDIGLLLAIQILGHDSTVFPIFRDEFLEIWFQSVVARKLTAQHSLTSALLNVERVSPLLETLPFDRNEETGRFAIEEDEFELRRLDALAASFRQVAKLLAPRDITAAPSTISKASLLNLLRGMLTAMKDNLAAIPDEPTRRHYATFCRGVLEALRGSGSAELNDQSLPDMRTLATATAVQSEGLGVSPPNEAKTGAPWVRVLLPPSTLVSPQQYVVAELTTIPSRLARLTQSSGSWPVAHARARSLYRQWYRAAPEITQLYAINFPASAIRAKVRQEFERNSLVDDLETVDILLLKGHQEFQETVNCWKMESQLMRWFANEELPARPDNFLDAFYLSRDETRAVQPTA